MLGAPSEQLWAVARGNATAASAAALVLLAGIACLAAITHPRTPTGTTGP